MATHIYVNRVKDDAKDALVVLLLDGQSMEVESDNVHLDDEGFLRFSNATDSVGAEEFVALFAPGRWVGVYCKQD